MPNWINEVLFVWAMRPRSLYIILLGLTAWAFMPLLVEWYWSGVHLHGQFQSLQSVLEEKYIKAGFWMMIGCFITAYKMYMKDRWKL